MSKLLIEFTGIIPIEGNLDLIQQYSIYNLLGTDIAEVDNIYEQARLNNLKPNKKYKITIEEV